MKITFLGTADGKPTAARYTSCTMLEVGENIYFIDCGAPLMDILLRRGVDLSRVKAIFNTHTHNDHLDGLLSFAALYSWYYRDYDVDIYIPEERVIAAYKELLTASIGSLDEARVRFHDVDERFVYDDGVIRLTPIPTKHLAALNRPAFSYLVEAEGKRVLFSGDLSHHLAERDFPAEHVAGGLDLMICELAHFGVEHVGPYLTDLRTKKLLFNHVFPLGKLADIAALNGQYGYPVSAVADGDEITL